MKIAIYLPGIFEAKVGDHEQVDLSEVGNLDDAAYKEIFVDSCLDFIEQRDDFIKELVKKIRYEGQIIISGSDIYEISRAMMSKSLSLEEANSIIYGGRYSISSVLDMVAKLQELGLTVLHKRVNDFKYTIIAERPAPNENLV
tara:strand:+ start:2995 stop:3423 length:429 start_codon:yes stop_codon:yes gene_type:complete